MTLTQGIPVERQIPRAGGKSVMVKKSGLRDLDRGFRSVGCEEGRGTEGTEERKQHERKSIWTLGYKTEALTLTYSE